MVLNSIVKSCEMRVGVGDSYPVHSRFPNPFTLSAIVHQRFHPNISPAWNKSVVLHELRNGARACMTLMTRHDTTRAKAGSREGGGGGQEGLES
jgi:hypothetical protein